jgi:hypothetical protein
MTTFFRFPHTPHLAWLGEGQPRDDKLLAPDEAEALLSGEVVVEEKVDGANIGFSTGEHGGLCVQNRGSYLDPDHSHRQFRPLWGWLRAREPALGEALGPDRMLFGEWCYAVHSVAYERLPDWFLGFDVYDRSVNRFWDTSRRDALLATLRLHPVPRIVRGHFTLEAIEQLLSNPSQVGDSGVEGLVVRRESGGFTTARAKLVRAEFTQAIGEHWSRGPLRRNELVAWP